jgi:hypothetical protein
MTEAIVVTPVTGASSSRAKKIMVIGLVPVLALFVGPKLLGGGGDGGGEIPAIPEAGAAPLAPGVAAGEAPLETSHNFSAKNPFAPLFEEGGSGDAGAQPVAASSPSPAPAPAPEEVVIVDTGVPALAPPVSEPAPTPAPAPSAPVRFGLVQVGQDAAGLAFASVRVDGGVFQAVEGQEFAGRYKILKLDAASRCGEFLFGDQRFSLCEGEETTT